MQRPAFALAAWLFALPLSAAEPPADGEDSVTVDFVVTSISPLGPSHRDDPTAARVEFAGVSHNDASGAMFDKLGVRCVGTFQAGDSRGDCTATDRDGDAIRLTYRSLDDAGAASAEIVGGTGKFAGLSGRFEGASAAIPTGPGLPLFVTRQRASWKWSRELARVGAASRD
jgi:hypothetical protein